MAVRVGHASIDENGKINGGAAGDQTGREVCTREWYNKGWNKLIRPKTAGTAEKIAAAMEAACANNKVGYDQGQRTTLYTQAKTRDWNIAAITAACECDCSSLVAVCVNAAGINVSKDIYTGNQAAALKGTGEFDIYTESKYLTGEDYLRRGDILLKEGSHTAIVLTNGSYAPSNTPNTGKAASALYRDNTLAGTYKTKANLYMRTNAGTNNSIILTIPKGDKVQNYGYYNTVAGKKWLYSSYGGITGYCSAAYLIKQ